MDCLLGIKFNDFVLIASDKSFLQSIVVMKTDENKLYKLSNKLVMAVSGDPGDSTQFAEYIAKNIQLYKMRNTYELSPDEAAHFTRRNIAEALRSQGAYHVNLLLAGYDDKEGPQLYYIDYLGSLVKVNYGAHGYGGFFSLSIMDRHYVSTLNKEQGWELLKMCVKEVQKRLIINLPSFKVQVIDKNGIQDMPDIDASEMN